MDYLYAIGELKELLKQQEGECENWLLKKVEEFEVMKALDILQKVDDEQMKNVAETLCSFEKRKLVEAPKMGRMVSKEEINKAGSVRAAADVNRAAADAELAMKASEILKEKCTKVRQNVGRILETGCVSFP